MDTIFSSNSSLLECASEEKQALYVEPTSPRLGGQNC